MLSTYSYGKIYQHSKPNKNFSTGSCAPAVESLLFYFTDIERQMVLWVSQVLGYDDVDTLLVKTITNLQNDVVPTMPAVPMRCEADLFLHLPLLD